MSFDPYQEWLDIPPDRRPPTYYDLLGLPEGETDQKRIRDAAGERYDHVKKYTLPGPLAEHANHVLEELSQALDCLIDPDKREKYRHGVRAASPGQPSGAGAAEEQARTIDQLAPLPAAHEEDREEVGVSLVCPKCRAEVVVRDKVVQLKDAVRIKIIHRLFGIAYLGCSALCLVLAWTRFPNPAEVASALLLAVLIFATGFASLAEAFVCPKCKHRFMP